VNEWIARVLPLPVSQVPPEGGAEEVARFRIRIVPPQLRPGRSTLGERVGRVDIGAVRILALDSLNPHGGVGGSLDSDQCAWLVRELESARDRHVIVATHDSSRSMTSDRTPAGSAPRVLGPEVVSILLAHPSVVCWISDTMQLRGGQRHGQGDHGFWEIPGASTGLGAPLAGGLSVSRCERAGRPMILLRGALPSGSATGWEVRDGRTPGPADARSSAATESLPARS
jgi:hypothetical protein